MAYPSWTRRDVVIFLGCVILAFILSLAAGCSSQQFKPQTPEDWVTWGYGEVETIANNVTVAREPDDLTGGPPLLSVTQGAEIKAILQDVLSALRSAEVIIGRGGNPQPAISKARLGIGQARALLRVAEVE